MSDLVSYNRSPDYISQEISITVIEISKIVGKSIITLHRTISLLKLPPEIQAGIRAVNLPVSRGYLFAASLDCPDLRNSL